MNTKDVLKKVQETLNITNINATPKIEKVIVAMGIGSLVTRKWQKDFEEFEKNLIRITGQKPRIIKSKQSISNFKLREGMPVMMQVTIRGKRAYDFLDRFNRLVLPRVRDFSGLNEKSFDPQANINIGLPSYAIFPELGVEDVTIPMGLQITIVTTAKTKQESKALIQGLGFIFQEKK